jgi:hypothetical protein
LDTCGINIEWRGKGGMETPGENLKLSIDHCWGC